MVQILSFAPSSIRARRRKPRSMFYDQAVSSNPAEKLLKEALVWLQPSGIEGESGEDAGSGVTAWRNSGTGGSTYDLTVSDGAILDTHENKSVVRFPTWLNNLRTSAGIAIPEPMTILCVVKSDEWNAGTTNRCLGNWSGTSAYLGASTSHFFSLFGTISVVSSPRSLDVVTLGTVCHNNGNYDAYTNQSKTSGSGGTPSAFSYGRLSTASDTTGWKGFVGEVLIWEQNLASDSIAIVIDHLMSEWAIQ